ncbi:SpoIIE family protein phosphatase [Streptomyces sp. CoT10]|uniref:SpoIIE family protein phosphatase n=1 Tax=Streptomyces sp. CoT10 TaxID=2875762 RepID=UPI0027E201BA|nr:SpoIIE family protein phosphatase [Streptomyces sp. CoT10]
MDTFALQADDLLLLHTDGVIEARNSHGACYPLTERIARWPQKSPPELVDRLCVDLLDHGIALQVPGRTVMVVCSTVTVAAAVVLAVAGRLA